MQYLTWFFDIFDQEVEYHEESGTLYYIKYRVAGGSK